MPKIYLVSLRYSNIVSTNFRPVPLAHLGMICLKEIAKQYNLEVEIIDAGLQNYADDEIFGMLLEAKPQVIGFSPFQFTMERTIKIIKRISVQFPETIIILGGVHVSLLSSVILQDVPEVDYIIKGEAESAFPNLLLTIFDKQKQDLSEIDGLVYRLNGGIIENKPVIYPELDSLPNLGLPQVPFTNEISLIASRGCASNCSFCDTPPYMRSTGGNKYRYQSPKKVIQDIEEILKSSNNRNLTFDFSDADFIGMSKKCIERAEEIADNILSRGISAKIGVTCQAKAIVKAGKEFWKKWKQAGLCWLFIGLESGCEEDLKYYNKLSNLEDAIEAYKILKECNIYFTFGFIMFNSYSNKERILKNISFLKDMNKLHIYMDITREVIPYPATKIYYDLEKENLLTFEKPYLITKIKYKNQFIEKVRSEICLHSEPQIMIDFFCYKFDYAIQNDMKIIEYENHVIKINQDLRDKYAYYIKLRAKKMALFISKMLDGSSDDLSVIGKKMNNSLIKIHEEFVSKNIIQDHKKSEIKSGRFSSIISFLKKKKN